MPYSEYLAEIFWQDPPVFYLASLIMHYRHTHTKWDKVWPQTKSNNQYKKRKISANDEVKAILLINHGPLLKEIGITEDNFKRLQFHSHKIEPFLKELSK